ncbi:MAG: cell division protein FtsZ [Alphaproteobacteria bacterium]|nr:cell division protein FtsZ [Alphaproteobacteria bacterium]MBV9063970.1 cell division protein FtsZ [Alphaproteobacteria bacterium]
MKIGVPEKTELRPRITVLGVGGAGGNAVNNMIASRLEGVEFVVANTDAQALAGSKAERRIQIGARVTEGLGAGARPEVGRAGAEETLEEILDQLSGSHMVFITAGMGGGTGTGAAPVIARAVREQGVLTVGVVTKPFAFEGDRRMRIAERGIEELQAFVDTLIIIPNQNLFRVANDRTTFAQAFAMADDVLHSGVRGVTDLIVMPGLINLDFADIKTVMSEMGKAMMGTGEAEGEERALKAAEAAISNPLLDEVSMKGARGVLINITGGADMTLFEVDQAANRIRAEVDPDANIIFGGTLLENMEGRLRVSVVATGIEAEALTKMPPNVEQLRPRNRPIPLPTAPAARPAPAAHATVPIRATANALPEDVRLQSQAARAAMSPVETMILGSEEAEPADAMEEQRGPEPALAPVTATRPQPMREVLPEARPEPKKRGFLGSWYGRKQEVVRTEPSPVARSTAQPRATTEVMSRKLEPQRAEHPAQADLDLNGEDQFEIPAFLRRQTN